MALEEKYEWITGAFTSIIPGFKIADMIRWSQPHPFCVISCSYSSLSVHWTYKLKLQAVANTVL